MEDESGQHIAAQPGPNYGTADHESCIGNVPTGPLAHCLSFTNMRTIPRYRASFRTMEHGYQGHLSAVDAQVIGGFLKGLHTHPGQGGRLNSEEEIRNSSALYPTCFVNFQQDRSVNSVHRFHKVSGSHLVRGMEIGSPPTPFLSIWLNSVPAPGYNQPWNTS